MTARTGQGAGTASILQTAMMISSMRRQATMQVLAQRQQFFARSRAKRQQFQQMANRTADESRAQPPRSDQSRAGNSAQKPLTDSARAAVKLELAERLLAARRADAAKNYLQAIVRDYPETRSAESAQQLLARR